MADLRERHLGPIATTVPGTELVATDVGALVRRLILFEHCTIESNQLKEIPRLIDVFGFEGVMTLLRSPDVSLVCDAQTTGQVGQTAILKSAMQRGGPLPLGSYRFVQVTMADRADYLHRALQSVHDATGLTKRQIQKLKRELAKKAIEYPQMAGQVAVDQLYRDLRERSPMVVASLRWKLRVEHGIEDATDVSFEFEDLTNDGDCRVRTNIATLYGLDETTTHKLVETALLGAAGLNHRLELMRRFEALTGFQDEEVQLFASKVQFLADQLDPNSQEERFERVVSIAGLPSLDEIHQQRIDVDRLMALRADRECRELRQWLRTISGESEAEIEARFQSIRERAASITHSGPGKMVRFLATNGVALIPAGGVVAGPAAVGLDHFLIDRLIGSPGPVSFLGHSYKSIFRRDE